MKKNTNSDKSFVMFKRFTEVASDLAQPAQGCKARPTEKKILFAAYILCRP